MHKAPKVGKPRSASRPLSLSSRLPALQRPLSAAGQSVPRPKPRIGRPGARTIAGALGGRK